MITVSNDFKTAMKSPTRELYATVTNGLDVVAHDDDLKSVKISTSSGLLRSVMRQCEIKYLGSHAMLGNTVLIDIGCSIPTYVDDLTKPIYEEDGETISGYYQKIDSYTDEAISYGSFIITSEETNQVTGETTAKGFDLMYLANEQYSLTPTYPIDLMDLVSAICTELGWTLNATSFPNDDLVIASELFSESKLTYRQILDQVAEASGSTIYFSGDDELHFRQVEVSSLDETLGLADMFSIKLEPEYTDINQLVASRMPQEDNILVKDDDNISANGIKELRIVNNLIIDSDRETYLPIIFAELLGLNFYPCEAKTIGLGYFEVGDRISVPDSAGTGHETVVMEYEVVMDGSLRETLKCISPDKTYTNLAYAGVVGQVIKNTEIIVNKQTGEIASIVSQLSSLPDAEEMTEIQTSILQNASSIELVASSLGGNNLLKNSSGVSDNLSVWQVLVGGTPSDADNTATVIRTNETIENTEAGYCFLLGSENYLTQNVNTLSGTSYTFYCKYYQTGSGKVVLNGVDYALPIEDSWSTFKVSIEGSGTISVRIESAVSETITIGDMVFKKGDVSGWSLSSGEVHGQNYKFDQDGLSLTNPNNSFTTVLSNTSLTIGDGVQEQVTFSSSATNMRNLEVTEGLEIQESDSMGVKIIPTATGMMIVVNDNS